MPEPILEIEDLHVYYGSSHILQGTSLTFDEGIMTLIGRNGMGKTTLMKAIMGLVPIQSGAIRFKGQTISGMQPHEIARLGIGYVPQGRGLFPSLTVEEHLLMAQRGYREGGWNVERVYELFPRLKERRSQSGTSLSGGEQQMLAMGRALVTNPTLVLMDEPAEGLAPVIVDLVGETIKKLAESGISVFLVEQNLHLASSVSDIPRVMVTGQIAYTGPFSELLSDRKLSEQYLGVGA